MVIKMIKTRLQNRLRDINFLYFMKTAIESSQYLSNDEPKKIFDIWNKKNIGLNFVCYALLFV